MLCVDRLSPGLSHSVAFLVFLWLLRQYSANNHANTTSMYIRYFYGDFDVFSRPVQTGPFASFSLLVTQ